ncbi:MAG: sugar phosphate isomerase/epimerase family protein [Nitrososphaerota archaeon]
MLCIPLSKEGRVEVINFPWKIGIVSFMAYPNLLKAQGVEEAIRELVEDPFFDLIELNFLEDENWNKISKIVSGSGKDFSLALQPFTNSPMGNISSLNEDTRVKAVEEIKKMMSSYFKKGIKTVALSSGSNVPNEKREDALDSLRRSLIEICRYAEKNNAHVLLETFDTVQDKKLLIGQLEDAEKIVIDVRKECKNIGILWDLSHGPFLNEKPRKLAGFKNVLSHIHIGCAKIVNGSLKDWHPSFYRSGAINGVEDLIELFSTLEEIGYSGAISFEVKPEEGQSSQEVIDVSKGILHTSFYKYLKKRNTI